MINFILTVFDDRASGTRRKLLSLYGFLITANVGAWIWAAIALHGHSALLASAALAYTLGLRHAVDADHIAAIDNVTRKLMQENKRPISAGFFFSLGHSAIVTLMAIAVCLATSVLESHFAAMKSVGGMISTLVSASYLFLLALLNLAILVSVYRTFLAVKRGEALRQYDLDLLLDGRGLTARLFRPVFRIANRSWHMFPIGFLFGLGFDTASEVALFGLAASQASQGMSFWTILVFPALFTAGMSLVDTTDGALMLGAYGWAYTKPIRKLFYNLTITFVSVVVAFGIAGVESLGLLRERLGLEGSFWNIVGQLNDHFGTLGYIIIAVFIGSWLASLTVYKLKRYDDLEVTITRDDNKHQAINP